MNAAGVARPLAPERRVPSSSHSLGVSLCGAGSLFTASPASILLSIGGSCTAAKSLRESKNLTPNPRAAFLFNAPGLKPTAAQLAPLFRGRRFIAPGFEKRGREKIFQKVLAESTPT